ncbi:MAG: HAMP domain-containing histidine kinase [Kofleriaceae bacterium]|nr:HAMP domain-containing histidine kinase [Kofleriaceae bacterium]
MSATWWLAGVIAAVVVVFVLATSISHSTESSIELRSNQLISNAMPSIQTLSTTRGDLRRLENDIERYAVASPDAAAELRAQISAERDYIAANFATYSALPYFPGEPRLHDRAEANLSTLAAGLARYLATPTAADGSKLRRELDAFDESIEQIITLDATQGQRLGHEIAHIHDRTRATAAVLDAFSVALAIMGLILAVRQLYRAREAHEMREAELSSQNEALGEFAGRVAHDIVSPLATTSLSIDLIRRLQPDNPTMQRALDRGAAAISRAYTLVNGLLTFSRAGGRPAPGQTTRFDAVVADVTDGLRAQAEQDQIELRVAPVPDGSVACSAGVLTSLVTNLLRNAIKHMGTASERRIELRVRDAASQWRFEIEDTGPGIPKDQQARIFEPYVQLADGSSGIGLGLATVDRLVRAHRGTVGVISPGDSGHGCCFWFELPKATAQPARETVEALEPTRRGAY